MREALNLYQQKFGRLLVVRRAGRDGKGNFLWECQCECGNITLVSGTKLKRGETRSCGCLRYDALRQSNLKHGQACGGVRSKEYKVWSNIKARCYSSSNTSYPNYGGRGIQVCDRWLDPEHGFENFFQDMGSIPSLKHSIDRIDNNGDYCPENCRWVTKKEQANNRRTNINIKFNGLTRTLKQWSEIMGIDYKCLWFRIVRYGWTPERALTEPLHIKKRGLAG